jgi:uncharacterized protein YjbI with pentapeptide repeats
MNAREVLRRYAAGERDFRRADLRGQSFKGQDLSGADFSEADIRGANFANAILRGVNFTGANGGLIPHKILLIIVCCLLLAGLGTFLHSVFSGILAATVFMSAIILFKILLQTGTDFVKMASQQFDVYHFLDWFDAEDWQKDYKLWKQQRDSISILFTLLYASIHFLKVEIVIIGFLLISKLLNFQFENYIDKIPSYLQMILLLSPGSFVVIGVLDPSSHHEIEAFFGTVNFQDADLTDSSFSKAILIEPNFFGSNCDRVCWYKVRNFGSAFTGDRHIINRVMLKMKLLIDGEGINKNFSFMDLEAVNLCGANLSGSSFVGTDLSNANLQGVNLTNAILMQTNLVGTDLTEACLTGACLEGWNIDSRTNLEQVDCQYVYLIRNQQERRPSSGDFAPGEFTKLFQEVLSTVDLIFRNGVDWKAFVAAFKQVQVENEDTPLEIQSIENKGDGVVVVRVSVPVEANKEKIHSEFNQQYEVALKALEARYQAELKAKESEITLYREQSANMWGVINALANRPINVQAIAKAMNESTDQSQNISVGGDFNLNAMNSVVNLRDISGSVTNTINQLPAASDLDRPGIKELLVQLQAVLESADEAALKPEDKADALEQVKVLAEAAQKPEDEKKTLGAKAIRFLRRIVDAVPTALPTASKLVEEVNKLVPAIVSLLGL